jgi:hypothetical protein
MGIGYWNVPCSNCNTTLRLSVSENDLGKTVDAICPRCGRNTRTVIGGKINAAQPQPQSFEGGVNALPAEVEEAFKGIIYKIKRDPDIHNDVELLLKAGFSFMLVAGLIKREPNETEPSTCQKVGLDGEIKPGTFSHKDEEDFSKFFRIKL